MRALHTIDKEACRVKRRIFGKGIKRPGVMNKTESAYASVLEERKRSGEIAEYWYEGIKLRLADKTFYTPDFFIMHVNGELHAVDVKGGWIMETSNVKIKCAAEKYPFKFFIAQLGKSRQWSITEV